MNGASLELEESRGTEVMNIGRPYYKGRQAVKDLQAPMPIGTTSR